MIKNENGQSIVETALLLPILLLLLVGIFDFGRILYTQVHLQMATQETVRLGGLGRDDSEIVMFAKDYVHVQDPTQLVVSVIPRQSSRKSGDYVTVELSYPMTFITPFLDNILHSPFEITANSTIRVE
ncbi:TadE/TadG family type IV pilus assembly protein [Calidifontibacillus oryziterrae]|uniref:TadE/TadG family type IV pilus assembly protein n=1 Tax=Calidifontibacillus oryziterrae TaxID=1191699 RepID=UPI0002E941F8|nr:TadE family protein [Calidifontibacillus oryziterrae]